MKNWIILFIAIIAEVIATSALKSSEGFTKPLASIVVVLGYVIAFYCLSLTLKTIPVGIAYAIWSGVGIVLITTVAWFVFDQKLDVWGIVGIALIMSGVLILNLLSKSSSH
ncbi:multidrug efflux SMR transporter [Acinetobacter vivianii]|jgi:multidrug transporter EmrE-like cation transporter|uniref:Multidrug efflux SMR transporter n=1 Tax=Acinetobacter vivianii TaxID=1776742 RepID=A0AAJ6NL47_9GAMM|nr:MULTISPECIES: multidrug efflux SMR transporter [Acinetobacter]KHF75898.1 Ethidium bromide-methyl viologen resistance protein EmrE [Acinetobacter sp. neg1]KYQ83649.1 ethidium bromide resistance protein [Acinetobacter sp. NRRL B-65365]MBJ8481506.1 multidrug efflux SMR transporter [Acinetobacter vivianii]MEB6666940.1 multidrug efflux SMR transporter [Acinetobacter vivianii]RPE30412.1 small multidrug resistance pump/small multidrug resistance pump [Acinetobacter sp. BIGb0102]